MNVLLSCVSDMLLDLSDLLQVRVSRRKQTTC